MKKTALFAFALVAGIAGMQAKIDYNAVEVENSMNRAAYNSLLQRFEEGDTTLTVPQMSSLYYGYAMTADYDPRDDFREISDAIHDKDYVKAAAMADSALALNPLSLELNLLDLTAYERKDDRATADYLRAGLLGRRCDLIANAILESGRGTTAQSPFYVTSETDMMCILRNVLGVSRIIDRAKVGNIDAIKVNLPGSDRMHIIYFDNTREQEFLKSHGGR